jgi:hypothetical protein
MGPQNQSQTWFPRQPRKNDGRREFDLDLKFSQMWYKKIKKNGKLVHGVMICDMVPRKNTKHVIPRSHRKSLHKKWHQAGFLPT